MVVSKLLSLAARVARPAAFGRRCIPAGCVLRQILPDILSRRALPSGRLAALGATPGLASRAAGPSAAARSRARESPRRQRAVTPRVTQVGLSRTQADAAIAPGARIGQEPL